MKRAPIHSHKQGLIPAAPDGNEKERSASRGSTSSSLGLLSNVPYSHPTASNVFGIGSEHPFANYWTCQGGLAEVISVLPEKIQADILLERYFECVDPVCSRLFITWKASIPSQTGIDVKCSRSIL